MSWHRSHYFKVAISGFLSCSLIVVMLAFTLMGNSMSVKTPDIVYRADPPTGQR